MPTRTAQGDILSVAFLSHGDTRHVMLIPASVKECFEMSIEAFDLAEQLQTPVFVLSDLDLGMNNWMTEPFTYPEKPMQRGKVLSAEDLTRLGGFARYKDVDGDGVGYRTLPGTDHPQAAFFTRGSGHNDRALYTERPDEYQQQMERLTRKFDTARKMVPEPITVANGTSKVGLIAYGTSDFAVMESREQLKAEYKVETDYLAHPRLSVHARDTRLCCNARSRIRDRAEPRRADAEPAEAGSTGGRRNQTAQRAPLQRPAD